MIVACVRTGRRYAPTYVERLRNMVRRFLDWPHRFVCLTDQPEGFAGVENLDISGLNLHGWWGKMALFREEWRHGERVLFFDLDTLIIGDLMPLAKIEDQLAICENFARLAGNVGWPCRYGSAVMVINPRLGPAIWNVFDQNRGMMETFARFGDQKAIEEIYPNAPLLQNLTPPGFFVGYRDLTNERPASSVVCFAGSNKPHNSPFDWVQEAWR